ncbi:MAG TPA: shikimate dehydrogenase [Nocardioidaceae bacterium]|nr:shikimate dehydrogenase [Nocardioidaceae bacterium]
MPSPGSARRCAVLGSPISHSLSPVLHRAAYAELGLDWQYDACEVREDQLAGFLDRLDDSWRGLSLTMPLKRAVVPLLDEVGPRARQAQAANTVVLEGGRRIGHNTDIPGAVAAIRERTSAALSSAVVFGGGATAASTVLALADLGCTTVRVVVRDTSRVKETLDAAGRHPARPMVEVLTFRELAERTESLQPAIVVSTIPAAAQGERVLRVASTAQVVFDVVYDPWPTPLARLAETSELPFVSGLDLLVHQAVLQVELMTGVPEAPLEAMRAAGLAALTALT